MACPKKAILITGATGLLGGHAVTYLRESHEVHAVVRAMPAAIENDVRCHTIDFNEYWSTNDLPKRVDAVIHLAQSAHFREFPEKALDIFRVNIDSTARLLDYAHQAGARHFIYASSGGIYGSGNVAFDEDSPVVQSSQLGYYLGSKLCGEVLAKSYAALMNVIILRFFFMYGKEQKRSMLIPRLIDNVKSGQDITIQGKDGIRVNPIHVSDATKALARTLSCKQSAVFNIAGPEVLSLRQIVEIMGMQLNIKPKFEIIPGEPKDLIGNTAAMEKQLYRPEVRIKDGIQGLFY